MAKQTDQFFKSKASNITSNSHLDLDSTNNDNQDVSDNISCQSENSSLADIDLGKINANITLDFRNLYTMQPMRLRSLFACKNEVQKTDSHRKDRDDDNNNNDAPSIPVLI